MKNCNHRKCAKSRRQRKTGIRLRTRWATHTSTMMGLRTSMVKTLSSKAVQKRGSPKPRVLAMAMRSRSRVKMMI